MRRRQAVGRNIAMNMHHETHVRVEECLAQAWTFLTGDTLTFAESNCNGDFAETGEHFMVTFHPAGADWRAGVILSLAADMFAPTQAGSEICNVFSGCAAALFPRNQEFVIGLPATIRPAQVLHLLDDLVFSRCYSAADGKVRVMAYEARMGEPAMQGRLS